MVMDVHQHVRYKRVTNVQGHHQFVSSQSPK